MAKALFGIIRRASSLFNPSSPFNPSSVRSVFLASQHLTPLKQPNPLWVFRNMSHGSVSLVISQGQPKFELHEVVPPKKEKWLTKKRLKLQRKKEKERRRSANKKDPRRLGIKGKKKRQKFATAEERIKYKLEKARIKEAMLIERLKRYEIQRAQGPVIQTDALTGEERFYMKKMAQKRSNYVPIGRRGVFGGVVLNMHMHWKRHETVKVICKPCKPGQVHEYAQEIARLSGGIPIQVIGDDTIIFYRGKNYVMPEVMSPIDTLSKKRALEKSKYEQSLESVRHFIAIAEKELELYYKHIALYGDPSDQNPVSVSNGPNEKSLEESRKLRIPNGANSGTTEASDHEVSEIEDDYEDKDLSTSESDSENEKLSDYEDEEKEERIFSFTGKSSSSSVFASKYDAHNHNIPTIDFNI